MVSRIWKLQQTEVSLLCKSFVFLLVIIFKSTSLVDSQSIYSNISQSENVKVDNSTTDFFPGLTESDQFSSYHGFLPNGDFKNVFLDRRQLPISVLQGPIPVGPGTGIPFIPLSPPPPRQDLSQVVLPYVKQKEGYIQGTGLFQCFLQGTFNGVRFVESVGYYRCIFRGARKTKGFVEGIGYYQLIYQKPGELQEFIQGIGMFQCNFQGVRHFHGFVNSFGQPIIVNRAGTRVVYVDPGVAERTAFIDIMAQYFSNLGNPNNTYYQNPGKLQLLGHYQIDIDGLGQHSNFGSLQGIEFYNLDLSILDQTQNGTHLRGQTDYISQQGEIDFSMQADQLQPSLLNYVGNLGYNFKLDVTPDETFFVFIGRYNYNSEENAGYPNLDYDHDHDFVQSVGMYSFSYPPGEDSGNQSHFQTIATYEYDIPRSSPDFIQLVAQYNQKFQGLDTTDLVYVQLLGTYQKKLPGGDANEFVQIVGQLSYTLHGEGNDFGFFQLYGFYDYFPYSIPGSNGYLQYICEYAFVYKGEQNDNLFQLQLQLQYQYNFPDDTPYAPASHGYCQVIGKWKIDLFYLGLEKRPSFLQLVMVYQCNFKGQILGSNKMCFVQVYSLYQCDVDAIEPQQTAYGQLLGQYYSEL